MKYTSINIQGNLISEDILQKIEAADSQGQLAKDFGFESGINLRSEIEYAWSRVKLDWKHFSERSKKLPASDPYGTTITRRWMTGFLSTLGFDLSLQKSSLTGDNDKSYSISHTCQSLDGIPVHITGFIDPNHPEKNTMDIRSGGGKSRLSPHATVQEYLNVTEYLYALVTNGLMLRLIRDSGKLVKLTYVEFDLKSLLDEDKYSEFTLLYRLLHASRFPKSKQESEESFLEKYYQDSIESGNRIRDGLSDAVKSSLITLGNGLLEHPGNEELREKIKFGSPDSREFYHQLLRLIYRLLFLIVTEERDLIFPELQDDSKKPNLDDPLKGINLPTKKHKDIYYQYYSLIRLRKLSEKRYLQESQYTDLWQGLMQTFSLFESEDSGDKLGILALGSELFSGNAMPDISTSKVNNKVLLQCIRSLNEFEDEKHNLTFINYRALDVEELGSVYEGLLELEPIFKWENGKPTFTFKKGMERSSSGSHYTPEDLVKPLIQHSLEYLIEERVGNFYKGKATSQETKKKLLDLKVCDIACGSGHILLSAARRIALEVARVETGEQQPNPTSFRYALKEVIRNCIYGVDKNPLAVELCKVALWLESHNPGEPLSFLDHRIKCGDAIVGLAQREELQNGIADKAYKKLPGDDKDIVSVFTRKNKLERTQREKSKEAVQLTTGTDHQLMQQVKKLNEAIDEFSKLPENTPDEIKQKEKAYRKLINNETLRRLKILADLQLMPFFLEKTEVNKEYLITDSQYQRYLRGETTAPSQLKTKAIEIAKNYRFFHWFLEFPEVFQRGGFDCILGNPPFLGGQKLSGSFGNKYLEYIKYQFTPIGAVDLVTYFFRRIFTLIKPGGFQSLISTNTIAQGRAREDGLDIITANGGTINHAIKSMKWPGVAAVEVALVTITKQSWKGKYLLAGKEVNTISPYLDDAEVIGNPYQLKQNSDKSFQGSIVLGKGFVLEPYEAEALIAKDPRNRDVLFPYLNGADLNNRPDQSPSRWVINFFDWTEDKAKTYPDCYEIVERLVKPERQRWKLDKDGNEIVEQFALRKPLPEKWWIYGEKRPALYQTIAPLERVLVVARISKTVAFDILDKKKVFADALVIMPLSSFTDFGVLQSTIHNSWAWNYCTTMKSDLNYTPGNTFETFAFPQNVSSQNEAKLEQIGETYHEHRKQLMLGMQLGLTKTYNAFHCQEINVVNDKWIALFEELDSGKELSKIKLKVYDFEKESLNLIRHFLKEELTLSLREAVMGIEQLRTLHVEMDEAVLDAYGWSEEFEVNSEKLKGKRVNPIRLRHDFYEVDYLPENDRIRFTIHPDARKEILKRLLELNHKIQEEEVNTGLWDKKSGNQKTTKNKTKTDQVNEPEDGYGGLFG
jgi:hypothetical protein